MTGDSSWSFKCLLTLWRYLLSILSGCSLVTKLGFKKFMIE
jgi:hypothetical protein